MNLGTETASSSTAPIPGVRTWQWARAQWVILPRNGERVLWSLPPLCPGSCVCWVVLFCTWAYLYTADCVYLYIPPGTFRRSASTITLSPDPPKRVILLKWFGPEPIMWAALLQLAHRALMEWPIRPQGALGIRPSICSHASTISQVRKCESITWKLKVCEIAWYLCLWV